MPFNQFADKIPAIEILDQPFLFNFDALINAAFGLMASRRALLDKALLDTMGVRVLMWQPVGNQVFFSKGRDAAAPQQIKDKTIRAVQRLDGEVREAPAAASLRCSARLRMNDA